MEKERIMAGNVEQELLEIEKLDESDQEAAPITLGGGRFFTILCCR